MATTRGTGAAADTADLVVEHRASHVGMEHRVDAGAAAALVGARKETEPQARYRPEHCQRLGLHLLRVLQVAGRIVDHVERQGSALSRAPRGEQLTHVAHPRPEMLTLARAKQVAVLLEQGAAPGTVHHDEVGAMTESPQVLPRKRFGTLAVARVLMQRPATGLPVYLHDTIAVGLEHAPGRIIHVAEDGVHDAAAKERYRRRGMGDMEVGEQARLLMAPGRASIPMLNPKRVPLARRAGSPVARNQRAAVSSVRQIPARRRP